MPDDILAGGPPGSWPWAEWSKQIHALALDEAGMAYATYLRLKISSVLDGFAGSINAICNYPEDSNHALLVCEGVRDTFSQQQLRDFLNQHGPNGALYANTYAEPLDALFEAAGSFLIGRVRAFAPSLLSQLAPVAADWNARRRRDLVVRYLGFPIWDVLLYPVQELSQTGEGDTIDVVRISPREATLLETPAGGKVEGTRVHHFYAFFSREARENDYLWGRLDAAEQLIRLLVDSTQSNEPLEQWCKRAFLAVLEEEQPSLTTVSQKVGGLRAAAEAL